MKNPRWLRLLFPQKKLRFAAAMFLIFSFHWVNAQNLVTDPSFETAAWPNANSGSADWLVGPSNVFGTENPFLGTRYMGISMGRSPAGGATDFREYVKAPLTAPLVVGNTYEVSVMVSLSENYGDYACNRIGFVTTNSNPYYAFSNAPIPLAPVYNQPTIITNKIGWTQVAGTFVATQADTYIIIGNFHTQGTTSWSYVGPGASFYYGYYFIDVGCLGPPGTCNVPLPISLLSLSGKRVDGIPVLEWRAGCSLNCNKFVVERSMNGQEFVSVAVVESKKESKDVSTYSMTDRANTEKTIAYYRIKEVEPDGSFHYSQMISIDLRENAAPHLSVYPVPAASQVSLQVQPVENSAVVFVFDGTGKVVFEKHISEEEKIELNGLSAGSYFSMVKDANGQIKRKKFIITGD